MNDNQKQHPLEQINDIPKDNLQALAQLFPSVVKDGLVDFEALKKELGEFEEVDEKEKYSLTWTGKTQAQKEAQKDTVNRTLNYIPQDSKNPDTTENLYIEGDNLEVLKLLRQNYYGSVKMIYIDPPYNTGNDFVYKDNFSMQPFDSDLAEGNVSEDGERLKVNPKSTNRYHANWLNMMYPRLKVARELLTEDGVIFISIDDNEQANLKRICDEIFGEENFVSHFIWEKRTNRENRKLVSSRTDYILCFCKNITFSDDIIKPLPMTEEALSRYKNPDNDPRGLWKSDPAHAQAGHGTTSQFYTLTSPNGKTHEVPSGRCWAYSEKAMSEAILDNRIWFGTDGNNAPRIKTYLSAKERGLTPETLWTAKEASTNESSKKMLKDLFTGVSTFETPKPVELVSIMLQIAGKDGYILDFFSGSATTAHAVMQLNAEDGGNRKFICVQIPEVTEEKSEAYKTGYETICEIGKERIRRAGDKIKTEVEEANKQVKMGEEPKKVPDIGFKVFRASDTNIKWNLAELGDNTSFEDLRNTPDLADFVMGAKDVDVVYEMLLRQRNIPLSLPLEHLEEIGSRTYLYGSTLLVCLENHLTSEITEKISQLDPLPSKFIFRDSSFGEDIDGKEEVFRLFGQQIAKNNEGTGATYTVDFI